MCGRFTNMFKWRELQVLMDLLDWTGVEVAPRYNLAPTQHAPVVRADAAGARHGLFMRWGLVPAWADDLAIGSRLINARAETIAEKPAFRKALTDRRCLVPVSGFYEWKAPASGKGPKQPYYIRRADGEPFALAGLWESNTRAVPPGGGPLETFTLITTTPNALMADLHDRMPVIVPRDRTAEWLSPTEHDPARLRSLLVPAAVEGFEKFPVGRLVSNPRIDEPGLVVRQDPVAEEAPPARPRREPPPSPPTLWG